MRSIFSLTSPFKLELGEQEDPIRVLRDVNDLVPVVHGEY